MTLIEKEKQEKLWKASLMLEKKKNPLNKG